MLRVDLAPYIRELILLNECVILPNFGGFETQYAAAQYDKRNKRMLPPTKKVHFRPDFLKGGDVLGKHLCKHLKINNDQAAMLIEEYVEEIGSRLLNNDELLIEGVGLFTKGPGGTLNFSPFERENYLAESFGLESLSVHRQVEEVVVEHKKDFKIRPRSNTFMFVVIGVIVISILMALTVFVSSKFDLYLFNIGDKNAQNDLIIVGNNYASDSTYLRIDNTLKEATDLKSALHYSEAQDIEGEVLPTYYLVAGSFKALRNAEITRNDLIQEGYIPEIIENKGYYRVTIGSFSNKNEALRELQRLRRQLDRSVWLLNIN